MGWLVKAIFGGLWQGLWSWLDRRTAEQNRIKAERDEAIISSQVDVKETEDAVKKAGDDARNSADSDFGSLR
jgi:hypothetical protein